MNNDLTEYRPTNASELFGASPRKWAKVLENKVSRMRKNGSGRLKALLIGNPGVGKTSIAEFTSSALVDSHFAIRESNGADVSAELVREVSTEAYSSSMFSDFRVWIINEIDSMKRVAQDLMLTFLDKLPDRYAVIGTSNYDTAEITERFQSRFQQMRIKSPEPREVSDGLQSLGIPMKVADAITKCTKGNVRSALLDAQSYLDTRN